MGEDYLLEEIFVEKLIDSAKKFANAKPEYKTKSEGDKLKEANQTIVLQDKMIEEQEHEIAMFKKRIAYLESLLPKVVEDFELDEDDLSVNEIPIV